MAAARSMRRRLGAAMAEHDVTPGQSRALRLVCDLDEARPSVLAERLHIAPRSATEVIDGLEAQGFVVRRPDAHDRRATLVAPTASGRRLQGVLDGARREVSAAYLDRLPPADRAELDRILRLLVDD